jgi:hypothetical protein
LPAESCCGTGLQLVAKYSWIHQKQSRDRYGGEKQQSNE